MVERIASSSHLRSSLRLRSFLFHIVKCSLLNEPEGATEQQIGIHIFGRPPGYNSSEDSIVRTHARLLRQKLAAYFADEGRDEEWVVEVPKGHYLPVFSPRYIGEALVADSTHFASFSEPALTHLAPTEIPPSAGKRFHWTFWLVLALFPVAALMMVNRWQKRAPAESPVDRFWHQFFVDTPPFVIYSNAVFTGDAINGLRYDTPQAQGNPAANREHVDTYTGIGELAAVYDLTKLFDSHQASFTLKRSRLVAWDEAQSRNLIFIGSSVENLSLRVLQPTTDFTMEAEVGSAGIVNHHPKAGEPAVYSRPEHPLTTDYVILALLPGVQPGKHVLVFSGLTTFGTEAAVEYVCSPDTVAELLKHISGPHGEIRPFEAVLQTSIGGGVPLQTHLVTVRVH